MEDSQLNVEAQDSGWQVTITLEAGAPKEPPRCTLEEAVAWTRPLEHTVSLAHANEGGCHEITGRGYAAVFAFTV